VSFARLQFAIVVVFLCSLPVSASLPAFTSAQALGGTRASSAYGVGIDGAGNVYIAGFFGSQTANATIGFGTTNLTSFGGDDAYIAKFSPAGICEWARQIGGSGKDEAIEVAVQPNGDCYVVGDFSGTASLGPTSLTSSGGTDIFIARFTAAGVLQWARRAGSTLNDSAFSAAVTPQGDCYLTGLFQGSAQFGGTNVISQGVEDAFLAKYSSNGVLEWVRVAGGIDTQTGNDIASDTDGNAYWVGDFRGSVAIGGTNLLGGGVFVARYDSSGALQWARRAGDGSNAGVGRVAVDANRNVYVSGSFSGPLVIDGQTLNGGVTDVFFAKYNPVGQSQWARMFGGSDADGCADIVVDALGNSYLVGHFRGAYSIGTNSIASSGSSDVLVVNYDLAGTLKSVRTAGGTMSDLGLAAALDGTSGLYIAGEFGGTATFGSTSLTASDLFQKSFFARLQVGASLRIERGTDNVVLRWSTNLVGCVLQSSMDPASALWNPVSGQPVRSGTEFMITNDVSVPGQFFRLSCP
jgi:hypothetical protein